MDKYLMLNELRSQLPPTKVERGPDCPEEGAYWAFWDDDQDAQRLEAHFKHCGFCKAEVVRVGLALVQAPELELTLAATVVEKLKRPLEQAKIVLQTMGGNLTQIFNSLQVVPAYRAQGPKALVVAAGGKLAQAEIEIIADVQDRYAIYVSVKKCRPRDGVTVQLEREGDVLRSVVFRAGDRSGLGTWTKGNYNLVILATGHDVYRVELDLR